MSLLTTLSPQQLRRAADLQEKILSLQQELTKLVGSPAAAPAVTTKTAPKSKGKRQLSAAGRARIVAAAKARWARERADKGAPSGSSDKPKPTRQVSPATRAKLAANMRARWAARKAGK